MKRRNLILLGSAVFALALIAGAPAATVYGWVTSETSPVALYGVEGTLLHGSVAGIGVQGKPVWQELRWNLHPLGLLTARIVADVAGAGPATLLSRVSFAPWGTALSDLRASGSLRAVLGAVGQGYLPVEGDLAADFPALDFDGGIPTSAEGNLTVERLSWTLAKDPLLLGDYKATASTVDDTIVLKIESVAGPLQVDGDAKLNPDKDYELDLRVKTKPEATAMLQSLVQSLGKPDPQGFYRIQRKGKLPT